MSESHEISNSGSKSLGLLGKVTSEVIKAYGITFALMTFLLFISYYMISQSLGLLTPDIKIFSFIGQQHALLNQSVWQAKDFIQAPVPKERMALRDQLVANLQKLQSNHNIMLQSGGNQASLIPLSDEAKSLYFHAPVNYHATFSSFVDQMKSLIASEPHSEATLQKSLDEITDLFSKKLSPGLNILSAYYDNKAAQHISDLRDRLLLCFSCIAALVLVQAFFILKPMSRQLRSRTQLFLTGHQGAKHKHSSDNITGLPDRVIFRKQCDSALKRAHDTGRKVAVLHIGLDRFKKMNQTYGHSAGDEVLQMVSKRLNDTVGSKGLCSYFSSDEFMVFLNNLGSEKEAEDIAEDIRVCLAEHYHIGHMDIEISASLGLSIYPDDEIVTEKLIGNAGLALSSAKLSGRNQVCRFTADLRRDLEYRHTIESDLRKAIQNDEFVMFFQPQVDSRDGRMLGVEALIRWQHPRLGLLTPAAFLDIAEISGLILPIGDIVIQKTLDAAKTWSEQGMEFGTVSINISGQQFADQTLMTKILAALEKRNLAPQKLSIEVMESVLLDHDDYDIREILNQFRSKGIGVELDDFGTGYASLAHLTELPITRLKIDRAFVQGTPHNQKSCDIVNSMIELSQKLNITILAEGVESDDQINYLKANNCFQIQGFRIARPMGMPELCDWLKDRTKTKQKIELVKSR